MHVNWSGLAGEDLQDVLTFLNDNELLGGIVGSHARPSRRAVLAHRGVRRGLPDAPAHAGRVRRSSSLVTGRVLETRQLPEIAGPEHAGDRRAHHDARPVLLVRHVVIRAR